MPDYEPPNYSEPGRGRRGFDSSGDASLDALARSDRFIDALANDQPLPAMGRADYELASLLAGWRDDMRYPEPEGLVTEKQAVHALRRGVSERRGHRGLAVIGSLAAAVLAIGGFGTVIYNAQPGDSLYSLRTTLFGEPETVRDDSVILAAQTELDQVQELISRGEWEQAQEQLSSISTQVENVEDDGRREELQQQWATLNVQVETRDPNATLPETSPAVPDDPNLTLSPLPGDQSVLLTPPSDSTSSATSTETSSETSTETTTSESPVATDTTATSTTEPSTVVELPPSSVTPTSTTVVPAPPTSTVPVEPPPVETSTVPPTITTTTTVAPQVEESSTAELPPAVMEPVGPAPGPAPVVITTEPELGG